MKLHTMAAHRMAWYQDLRDNSAMTVVFDLVHPVLMMFDDFEALALELQSPNETFLVFNWDVIMLVRATLDDASANIHQIEAMGCQADTGETHLVSTL